MATALAQSVELAELDRCAELETDELRLACFEAIVATHRVGRQEEPEPQDEPSAAEPRLEPPPQAGRELPPVAMRAAEDEAESVSEAAAPVQAAAEVSSETGTTMDEWGLEDRRRTDMAHASVVNVTRTGYGELVFHFDNGQVWKQQEKRYFPYPKDREFDVTISTGMMGEYRLQVEGAGRRTTIKRLQ